MTLANEGTGAGSGVGVGSGSGVGVGSGAGVSPKYVPSSYQKLQSALPGIPFTLPELVYCHET